MGIADKKALITIGIKQTNKCMQLSAIAYNLKKYMKFIEKRTKSGAGVLAFYFSLKNTFYKVINMLLKPFKTPGFLSL
ncbi:hypothetical protein BWZ22_00880 [Seonamhaeicola sp. S2-3]|nr:hypothetical protein BWZ22_00880 [Seonamhaeicola sp. S2-3]